MHSITSKILTTAVLFARYVTASSPYFDTSGYDVQTLGVGADGATTYIFSPDTSSTLLPAGEEFGFGGPATVVIGASTLGITYIATINSIAYMENCGITNGVGVCTDILEYGTPGAMFLTTTGFFTQTFSTSPVQGGAPTAVTTTSTGVSTGVTTSSAASSSASTTTTTTQNKTSDGVKSMFTPFSLMLWGSIFAFLMVL
ncbi:uncharacterized protein FIBRA_08417 [Fibroporia radiculosa]|uniref:Uncharacterized protein n=1 Tax=Fibroporia radiculosa TaxID=599839 RepID=J4GWR9_9APHY|nr:uncharacterized protein FIBRA_08417 [Fibroporia radiculosa]CCM06175.1 predicted protein [Fibroporia radiculosa]